MAQKAETTLIASIHKHIPNTVYKEKMHNIYHGGTADVWYSGPKADMWIEYKWLAATPVRTFTPALSKLQSKWLEGRHAEGRNVAVVIGWAGGAIVLTTPLEWDTTVVVKDHVPLSAKEVADWITHECA